MKYEILSDERMPGERVIKVRVAAESVEGVWAEEVGRLAKDVSVPGFRKGKAPLGVVERHVGRESIWHNVREVVAGQVSGEMLRDAEPKPIAPPTFSYGDEEEEDEAANWEKGMPMVCVITYLLPPPSPEEIERDLLRKSGVGDDESKPTSEEIHKTSDTMPTDPRSVIPGSGISDEN